MLAPTTLAHVAGLNPTSIISDFVLLHRVHNTNASIGSGVN